MKKLPYIFVLLLLISACNQNPETEQMITLTGTITNASNNEIRLANSDMDTVFNFEGGSFTFSFQNEKPAYYNFRQSGEYTNVYLRPGDSLNIELDASDFDESISYSGGSAGLNQYLAEGMLLRSKLPTNKELFSLDENDFLLKTDSITQAKRNLLAQNRERIKDEIFLKYELASIKYDQLANKIKFQRNHRHYAKDPEFIVSDDFNKGLTGFDLNDSTLLEVSSYTGFLSTYVDVKVDERMESDTIKYKDDVASYIMANLNQLNESFTSSKVKSTLMYDFLSSYMTYIEHESFEKHLMAFNEINSDENRYKKLNTNFKAWKKLAKGAPAPDFKYVSAEGDSLTMSDFTGKYVYIDIWATWCGPCLRELPALELLQEEYKDKNITFVSVSIDNTPKPWKKMVEEKEMKGVQLYADGAWKSTIIKDYMIKGIPRFILVDTEGKLIAASTERPSGGIKEILGGLENI